MPVPLPLIGMGLSAISQVPQFIAGIRQNKRADQLSEGLERPVMDIPESQLRALESAEAQAGMTRLPGQSGIEGRLDQTTANKIAMLERLSTGGATSINAASRAYGDQMDAENKLGVDAASMYLRNQDVLRNELGKTADWENKAWQYNEAMPYQQTVNSIEALREGSLRNQTSGLEGILGSLGSFFGNLDASTTFKDIFGGGSQIPSTTPTNSVTPTGNSSSTWRWESGNRDSPLFNPSIYNKSKPKLILDKLKY